MNRRQLIKQAAAALIMARLTPLALPAKTRIVVAPSPSVRWDVSSSSPLADFMEAAELIRNQPFDPEFAKARQKVWSSIWP